MMVSKNFLLAAFVAGTFVVSAAQQAAATPISPPTSFGLGDIASHGSGTYSFLVGDITYSFASCAGNGCTNDNVVLGVPASPATGPGGGIVIQSASGISNTVLPVPGVSNPTDITLTWVATTPGNQLTGATGSAIGGPGTSGASGGGTSLYAADASSLGHLNMTTTGGPSIQPFPMLQNIVAGITDISATGTGYLNSGTIFLSEVPEPASIALLLSALGGLGYLRRRNGRAA